MVAGRTGTLRRIHTIAAVRKTTIDVLNTALVSPFESIRTDSLTLDDRCDRNLGFAALPGN